MEYFNSTAGSLLCVLRASAVFNIIRMDSLQEMDRDNIWTKSRRLISDNGKSANAFINDGRCCNIDSWSCQCALVLFLS